MEVEILGERPERDIVPFAGVQKNQEVWASVENYSTYETKLMSAIVALPQTSHYFLNSTDHKTPSTRFVSTRYLSNALGTFSGR